MLADLRFADHIVLFGDRIGNARKMLKRLQEAFRQVGLKINFAKTQTMKNLTLSEIIDIEGTQIH